MLSLGHLLCEGQLDAVKKGNMALVIAMHHHDTVGANCRIFGQVYCFGLVMRLDHSAIRVEAIGVAVIVDEHLQQCASLIVRSLGR